jgi:uncharacterized protein (DUF488 family)
VRLFTAGHSNRSAAELVALLEAAGIACVADVRRYPVSRRFPQHSRARLEASLAAAGIRYVFLGDALGGRREPEVPPERSRNAALADPALRAFADALDSPELEAGLRQLEALGRAGPTASLCAERDWRDCHRRIVSDALAARGWEIVHLIRPGESEPHRVDPKARVESGRVWYPTLV